MSCDNLKNLTLIKDINKRNGNYWSTFYHDFKQFHPRFHLVFIHLYVFAYMVNHPVLR